MQDLLNIGVIGLGVMGQRMLERLQGHERLRVVAAWDANPATVAVALGRWPQLPVVANAEAVIARPGLQSLYIATPPAAHIALSERAFDAGLSVFCEKPLTTDFAAGQASVERIEAEGHRAAVNFALASSPGLALLQTTFGAASRMPMGALKEVELELAFSAWPRPWQAGAGSWLSERAEGGFSREVLSHFIFVLQRVLGPAAVLAQRVSYPEDGKSAETLLRAELLADGVPVRISGRVDPSVEVPDHNRMVWRTADGEIELRQWFTEIEQRRFDGVQPPSDPVSLRAATQVDQLKQWVAMIEGQSHSLPGFAESLAVQHTIEALLKP